MQVVFYLLSCVRIERMIHALADILLFLSETLPSKNSTFTQ